jgi:hypothetical protein
MSMRYAKPAAVLILGSAIFVSCQCEKATEPLPSNTTGFAERPGILPSHTAIKVAAKPTATAVQVVAASTPTVPSDLKMPDDFPKDVPVFKGAQLSQVQDLPNNAHNVIFSVAAPVSEVNQFYSNALTKAGWTNTQSMERPEHAFMTFEQGKMKANVTIAEDAQNPGKKVIAIMYYEELPLDFDEF